MGTAAIVREEIGVTNQGAETVLRPTPGDGLLARAGELVVLYHPDPEEGGQQLLQTLETVARSGGDGRSLVRELTRVIQGMDQVPAFVAYGPTGSDRALLLHGFATALVGTASGEIRLDGAEAVTWVDRILRGVTAVSASLGAEPPGAASAKVRLDNGVVPAGGFMLTHGDAAPAGAGDAAAAHAPAWGFQLGHPAEPVAAGAEPLAGAEGHAPQAEQAAPEGGAVPRLPEDPPAVPPPFAEAPDAGFSPTPAEFPGAPTNEISRDMGPAEAQQGAQASLGLLVLDDGQTFTLDTSYVIGREPEPNMEVVNGNAAPVRIQDPDALVSRAHAMVALDGWDVQVVDLGSANGTYVFPPGAIEWAQVPPHQPTSIVAGTHIAVGGRVFAYESHGVYEPQPGV